MLVNGRPYRSIWFDSDVQEVQIIDQTLLPHHFEIRSVQSLADMAEAIRAMRVRGAPLIGVSAAFGLYLALRENPVDLDTPIAILIATRPTAVNLAWAMNAARLLLSGLPVAERAQGALQFALQLAEQDVATCEAIGTQGCNLLEQLWQARGATSEPLQILTHCNAGWLATVDWGTALSVIYKAQARGIPLHVWVDETRPRNQGAFLTTWELQQQGIDNTLIADNTGGHLMQHGLVDLCLVGSDRTTASGDVCNKIGTYLKALAARDNNIPFYVALPVSTIDFELHDGVREIPIEQRDADEVLRMTGLDADGVRRTISLSHIDARAGNYSFDVTPARLVTALITEQGVIPAEAAAIATLKP
ncbi:MAG: S-methyl-5-thioribose-1-phosphate isomerase [Gammaproteobacteria bacterium]|nr:S-methyl-5-thioribose-1-phosphate isomerase [Pseudomonadales bacterium]MCP5345272.1 S-methyl-5-thioribose-1-phosphate isomerase [Pseudomonadales bacterium]